MTIIRPRLNDHFDLALTQETVDFAIPFLDEDIPLCVDPFLLWKSPSLQDNSLHTVIVNSFNHLGYLVKKGKTNEARDILIGVSECDEVGLGFSSSRKGRRLGKTMANRILGLFENIPQLSNAGFTHFEEIQLLVDNVSKDRVSDIACNYLLSFLIDFTIQQCDTLSIPTQSTELPLVYDYRTNRIKDDERAELPVNPETSRPLIFVPKRWLRAIPWVNYQDYVDNFYTKEVIGPGSATHDSATILNFNRSNYDVVLTYTKQKERVQSDCKNDPLFKPIPILSATRKISKIKALPTGKTDNADRQYEDLICQVMASMLYPHLDFADVQSRTDSGVLIRDLVFYNGQCLPFLKEIYNDYGTRQIVMELKNVQQISRDHINQLNRYLCGHFGRFGILITRHPLSKAMFKNTIDLWAGQRRCIICITDEDLEVMRQVFSNKQRLPIEVINKKLVEFYRACPS